MYVTGYIWGFLLSATIKDIADSCGVSKTTVSRFLNNSGYVSKDVATKIEHKIKELNYSPSETARSLSTKSSNVIGVVIPEVSNPFFAEIFKGISQVADKNNLNIFYCDTDNDYTKEHKTLKMLKSYNVSGIIIAPASNCSVIESYDNSFIETINSLNTPVILLDRDIESVNWDGVFSDNYKGAYECTKLLLENGHKTIATITGDLNFSIGRERHKGFLEAIKDSDLDVDENNIYKGDFTTETAYNLSKEILLNENRPTGIFSTNNLTTIGILKALSESNLSVPKDMSIVCFDDIDLLSALNIRLSVASRDAIGMGKKAMRLLIDKIGKQENSKVNRVIIKPKIIKRGSERLFI